MKVLRWISTESVKNEMQWNQFGLQTQKTRDHRQDSSSFNTNVDKHYTVEEPTATLQKVKYHTKPLSQCNTKKVGTPQHSSDLSQSKLYAFLDIRKICHALTSQAHPENTMPTAYLYAHYGLQETSTPTLSPWLLDTSKCTYSIVEPETPSQYADLQVETPLCSSLDW